METQVISNSNKCKNGIDATGFKCFEKRIALNKPECFS
jgi:hypothetical protein